jgi:hypothetical protein
MQVPGIGAMRYDEEMDWLESRPVALGLLQGHACAIIFDGYDEDAAPDDFLACVANLLAAPHAVLLAAEAQVLACNLASAAPVALAAPDAVWQHVRFGDEVLVARAADGDVYALIECECDWAPEEGLQFVLRHGALVTEVGPFDGQVHCAS